MGIDHNFGYPFNQPRHLTRKRLIAQALHRLILQLRLVLAGFMIKAAKCPIMRNRSCHKGQDSLAHRGFGVRAW
jgi:hypothetical protein